MAFINSLLPSDDIDHGNMEGAPGPKSPRGEQGPKGDVGFKGEKEIKGLRRILD